MSRVKSFTCRINRSSSTTCAFREEEHFHFSLKDFKCVAVLGRGHFGKVRMGNIEWRAGGPAGGLKAAPSEMSVAPPGAAGGVQEHRGDVCHQGPEEGRHRGPGRGGQVRSIRRRRVQTTSTTWFCTGSVRQGPKCVAFDIGKMAIS